MISPHSEAQRRAQGRVQLMPAVALCLHTMLAQGWNGPTRSPAAYLILTRDTSASEKAPASPAVRSIREVGGW